MTRDVIVTVIKQNHCDIKVTAVTFTVPASRSCAVTCVTT